MLALWTDVEVGRVVGVRVGRDGTTVMGRIVVGVDGSEGADTALGWAVEEARLRRATLEVVYALAVPTAVDLPITPEFDAQLASGAQAILDASLAQFDLGSVELDARVERGPAALVLVERARGTDLLVVGSRGRGGFAGLLLGSVSQQCAHHAPCPIVIVPAADREPRA